MQVQAIPDGYTTLTAHLTVNDANEALAFYQKAFDAQALRCVRTKDGKTVLYAVLKVGTALFVLNDPLQDMGAMSPIQIKGSPVILHLYVKDADAVFAQALTAGARATLPLAETFWGDRYGRLIDPFGHQWAIASRIAALTDEQIQQRGEEATAALDEEPF